tara:strand:+ start:529 stop:774 length:246 start_codon:yes stop_codon:yes gene_type:complete
MELEQIITPVSWKTILSYQLSEEDRTKLNELRIEIERLKEVSQFMFCRGYTKVNSSIVDSIMEAEKAFLYLQYDLFSKVKG